MKRVKQSAISVHLLGCNSLIDFHHFDVLVFNANKFRHLIEDRLFTERDENKTIKSSP